MYELICVGASWGGLDAISRLLSGLPGEVDLPIVVAQHRHVTSPPGALADLLHLRIGRPVQDVEDKMPIEPRNVYLAPPDYHLLVQRGSFALSTDARVQFARPSIDVLFESAAHAYGRGVIGIILTGANEDAIVWRAGVRCRGDPGSARSRQAHDARRRDRRDRGRRSAAARRDRQVRFRGVRESDGGAVRPRYRTGGGGLGEPGGSPNGSPDLMANVLLVDDRRRSRPSAQADQWREFGGTGRFPRPEEA